jgi:hypothetical protein
MKAKTTKKREFWEIGRCYFIRTVTHYLTGRLVSITPTEIVLEDAAWIADTGRFADFLKTGNANEVEPVAGPVLVSRGAIVDVYHWPHDLPREQK